MRALIALLFVVAGIACDESSFDAEEATRLAQPHLVHFEAFDRWARRALIADPAIRDRDALEESVFAPIRREDVVQGAWIVRDGARRPLSFGHLEEPPEIDFRTVRVGQGEIDVSTAKVPDPRTRRLADAPRRRAILLRRVAAGDDGIEVTVTVAYSTQ